MWNNFMGFVLKRAFPNISAGVAAKPKTAEAG